tara:strand:- start:225 stop:635 length:411 start_codon:yes stop_codon:yes gene_type:complete
MSETVDVLVIGAGASGAAFAWSMAETRMRIVCLEQGEWLRSSDYPSNGRDWEARALDDFAISPNTRGLPADYPVNDEASPIKVANFNAVGGSTILYAGHFRDFIPLISACVRWTEWRTTGQSTTKLCLATTTRTIA